MNNLFKKKKKYLYLITPTELLTKKLPLKKYLVILNEVLKTKKIISIKVGSNNLHDILDSLE